MTDDKKKTAPPYIESVTHEFLGTMTEAEMFSGLAKIVLGVDVKFKEAEGKGVKPA